MGLPQRSPEMRLSLLTLATGLVFLIGTLTFTGMPENGRRRLCRFKDAFDNADVPKGWETIKSQDGTATYYTYLRKAEGRNWQDEDETVTTFEKPVGLLPVDLEVKVRFLPIICVDDNNNVTIKESAFFSKYNKESNENNKLSNEWTKATLQTTTGNEMPHNPSNFRKKNSGCFSVHVWTGKFRKNFHKIREPITNYVLTADFKHIKIDMDNNRLVVQTHCPDGCSCGKYALPSGTYKEGFFEVKDIALSEMEYIKNVCVEMGHASYKYTPPLPKDVQTDLDTTIEE